MTTPAASVRNLPKLAWILVVILLMDIGSIAWLVAGRNWSVRMSDRLPAPSQVGGRTAPSAAARRTRGPVRTNPDDDEEFLETLRLRVAEQRRRAGEGQQDDPPVS